MHKDYLGDSYDLVKRFWCESLRPIAPLYAHERFVPPSIRGEYTKVTTIPILSPCPDGHFGVLLDPDTGVPLPGKSLGRATAAYAPLTFIAEINEKLRPDYMICFDQSYHRNHELSRVEQRGAKRSFLRDRGLRSFYICLARFDPYEVS